MGRTPMTPDLLAAIAERFKVLGEPARLQILQTLRRGERTVSELVEETGMGQANVSKHLQQLLAHSFVIRRKEGLYAWYRLADQDVFRLCDIMCGGLERDVAARRKLLAAG
jgi:DNA-binding transcriptional ArsR family regulator